MKSDFDDNWLELNTAIVLKAIDDYIKYEGSQNNRNNVRTFESADRFLHSKRFFIHCAIDADILIEGRRKQYACKDKDKN